MSVLKLKAQNLNIRNLKAAAADAAARRAARAIFIGSGEHWI